MLSFGESTECLQEYVLQYMHIVVSTGLILLLLLYLFTFIQGIYNYILEANHVSRVYVFTIFATCNVISHVKYVLYFYVSTF